MTDLERLWDDLPVGPAPTDRILREGRAADRERSGRSRRPWLGVGLVAGLGGAFLAGALVAQPGSGPADPGPDGSPGSGSGDVVPAAFHGDLQPAASCAELLDHYVDEALDLVGPYGWEVGYSPFFDGPVRATAELSLPANGAADRMTAYKQASPSTTRVTNSDTGTNVQEVGVDESDVVKTDGEILVRIKDADLTTYDVSGDEVRRLGSLDLGDLEDSEILLAGDTVVAIGNDGRRSRPGVYYEPPEPKATLVLSIDVSDPADPTVVEQVEYDTSLVSARQHGDDVRLVMSGGLPELDFVRPTRGRGIRSARAANERAVRASTLEDWLPQVSTGGGSATDLLDCDDVAIPEADLALDTMAVVGFSADAPTDVEAIGLAADTAIAYESADHLYLASGSDDGVTHVFDFELDGTRATYLGSGEVEGAVADRWAMDEYDGVLRLAVGPTRETGNFNSVVTLQMRRGELVETGRVDKLGVNEDIMSVRWFDGLAIVVTFRRVDPLYAIDLTDADDPTLIGELKIPGFSDYLHPLGSMRMIGMGQGPVEGRGWGGRAGLFDVTDLSDPRQIDVLEYAAGSTARAGQDPRQFTWLPSRRIALTIVQRNRTGFVSVLQVGGGELENRMVEVDYGSDVEELRLVPTSPDRVVLVTGEDVEFFDL